ncbi:cadherin-related family member 5 [Salarias fasciatus]|uniref:cadherin-related family member 5 n=1 Tax=Salarias fasciatus TaxID=181472 RepID=UPI00117695BB|nr:cadherin-related family member 5-like [Salarias fasciatus]
MLRPCRLLLWQATLRLSYHVVTASLCLGGSDIFASVPENSSAGRFVSDVNIRADPGANTVRLCLSGQDAEWFYLEGRTIRLNTSASRVLDREVVASVLIAELTCYEDDVVQGRYRILVEVLNENDNTPAFLQETVQPLTVSEVTAVNSVVFTVRAVDADGDMITYIIDKSWPDAHFFRIDLPNSGSVVLNKPLDYETKTRMQLVLWAEESNTVEKFNTSAVLDIIVDDGDDHYPHFLPCTPVSPGVPVCMNPTYSTNITQKHQDIVLEFSPGPIRAEDGDRGIDSPLIYSILSGDDQGRFVINSRTGDIRLTRAVDDLLQTRNFTLSVMVHQVDDRLKYSVASVLVRVLHENLFPPAFNRTTFKGFIIQSSSPASIVSTYGNQVLQMQAFDRDFSHGHNPNIHYSVHPPSGLYQVTQDGVLIARTDQLRAFDRHILQVVARDKESGEEASASVDVEVLQRGQAVPRGAFTEQQLFGHVDSRLAGGIALMLLLLFLSAVLFVLLRTVQRGRLPEPRDDAAAEKQSSVVSSSPQMFMDDPPYSRAFGRQYESAQGDSFHGAPGIYTRRPSHRLPASALELANPAGRCRFHTDLFAVVEKPPGGAHGWEIALPPLVPAGLSPTEESDGSLGGDNSDGTTSQSQETLREAKGEHQTMCLSDVQPIREQDPNPSHQPIIEEDKD